MKEIDAKDLNKILSDADTNHVVVDIRTLAERTESFIPGTFHMPMSTILEQVDILKDYDTVYIYCNSGGRSALVCSELAEKGLKNTVNVRGGIMEWNRTT